MTQTKPTKKTYTVTLPDGSVSTRTSAHDYTYAIAIRFIDSGKTEPCRWFCSFRSTLKLAEAEARMWKNCPSVKDGYISHVETVIIPLA